MAKKTKSKDGLPVCVAIVVCNQVVNGNDGTATLVRIVDTIGIDAETPPNKGDRFEVSSVSLFVSMKNADAKKKYELIFDVLDPSGTRSRIGHAVINPVGNPEAGQQIISPVRVLWGGEGVYWIELTIGESLIGRSPIRLTIATPKQFEEKISKLNKKK